MPKQKKCCNCSRPAKKGSVSCKVCLESCRKTVNNLYIRRKAAGLCWRCGANQDNETLLCQKCRDVRGKKRAAKRPAKNCAVCETPMRGRIKYCWFCSPSQGPIMSAIRREHNIATGRCVCCGKRKARKNRQTCKSCGEKRSQSTIRSHKRRLLLVSK